MVYVTDVQGLQPHKAEFCLQGDLSTDRAAILSAIPLLWDAQEKGGK